MRTVRIEKTLSQRFRNGLALLLCWFGVGAAAIGQERSQFTGVQTLTNQEILLRWTAPLGLFRIESSTNLARWNPLLTLVSTGMNQHVDSGAPYLNSRFYRALQLAETNTLTGDHLMTEAGEVVFHPVNHASFVMSWNGKMIYNDPVGGSGPYLGFPRADLILVSHGHGDHFSGSTLDAVRGSGAVIIASQGVYNSMTAALRGLTTVLTNGASTNVMGLTVEAVPSYNLTVSNHPRGVGNGYVLTIGGKRIFMSGDSEDIPETRALVGIDVAFVAMNVPFTMSVDKAISTVRDFRPRVIYPYHFRNQDNTLADLNRFKRQVGTDLGIEVRIRKWY